VKYDVAFAKTLDDEWYTAPVVYVGPPTSDAPAYVLVTRRDGVTPYRDAPSSRRSLVIALNEDSGPFRDAVEWRENIVVGYGEAVHVISLATRRVVTHLLDSYFGHLYALGDALLVTDARYALRLDADGGIVWRSPCVGIDGVTIDRMEDGVVFGEGEYDPPGGWRSFCLSLESGELIPA
jgi:hypothetical protein